VAQHAVPKPEQRKLDARQARYLATYSKFEKVPVPDDEEDGAY